MKIMAADNASGERAFTFNDPSIISFLSDGLVPAIYIDGSKMYYYSLDSGSTWHSADHIVDPKSAARGYTQSSVDPKVVNHFNPADYTIIQTPPGPSRPSYGGVNGIIMIKNSELCWMHPAGTYFNDTYLMFKKNLPPIYINCESYCIDFSTITRHCASLITNNNPLPAQSTTSIIST